jgi:catalase
MTISAAWKTKSRSVLVEEVEAHLVQEPMRCRLLLQLPNPGDPTNDASIVWPDDRKTIDLSTTTITTVDPNSDAAQRALTFDPYFAIHGVHAVKNRSSG